ncbi:hypothetical protein C8Q80DRAFT_178921 [Daedaleopsis nitida]|nr:hypothetical protein C8Q80DRAFT_178921 [Daedaleopsis nitida]
MPASHTWSISTPLISPKNQLRLRLRSWMDSRRNHLLPRRRYRSPRHWPATSQVKDVTSMENGGLICAFPFACDQGTNACQSPRQVWVPVPTRPGAARCCTGLHLRSGAAARPPFCAPPCGDFRNYLDKDFGVHGLQRRLTRLSSNGECGKDRGQLGNISQGGALSSRVTTRGTWATMGLFPATALFCAVAATLSTGFVGLTTRHVQSFGKLVHQGVLDRRGFSYCSISVRDAFLLHMWFGEQSLHQYAWTQVYSSLMLRSGS